MRPGRRRQAVFPRDLHEAAARLRASSKARELFGDDFVDSFAESREVEHAQYQRQVSEWEIRRYLGVV